MGMQDSAEMYERRQLSMSQFRAVRTALANFDRVMLVPYGAKGQSYIIRGREPLPSNLDARADELGKRLVGYLGSKYVRFYPRFDSEVVDNLALVIDRALGIIPEQKK
jgi:hypothetical protein